MARRRHDRQRQELVRRHAVAVATDIAAVGYTAHEIADLLHITSRTLWQWRHDTARVPATPLLAGRPAALSPPDQRNDVLHFLDEHGPGIGLAILRAAFPIMTRAELDDLLKRYRRVWRARHLQPLQALTWTRPGRVWAVDFAQAPAAIDGRWPYLLAVRDLASGRQLLWQPVPDLTAATAATAFASLFVVHGAPLVLKSDNGSAFGAAAVAAILHAFDVTSLFSPPHTPRYNGSIEAGIGALKTRSEAAAARRGHPGHWTWDDVAAARLEANATARPRGLDGPTPDEIWRERASIVSNERVSFGEAVDDQRRAVRDALDLPVVGPLPTMTQRRVDRIAIRRALVERGDLLFTRRTIPPTIPRPKSEVDS